MSTIAWTQLDADAKRALMTEAAGVLRTAFRENPDQFVFVYAIQAGENGPVKIGQTVDPATRLATLQQGNPADLRGLAAWPSVPAEERQLHEEFAYARIRGEWFRPVPELLELVGTLGGYFEDWT